MLMKYLFTFALSLVFYFVAVPARGCDCISSPSFCESVAPDNSIILGVVKQRYHSGDDLLDIEVLEWIKPTGIPLPHITLIGGNGGNCVVVNDYFNRGDTIVLTPSQLQHHLPANAHHTAFILSECAVSFLRVKNGVVKGNIRDNLSEVHLSAFVSVLKECVDGIELNDMKLFPNPVGDIFHIQLSGALLPDRVRFYNVLGQEVSLHSILDSTGRRLSVNTSSLSAGVYFAVLQFGNYRRTFKWVKR